MKRKNKTKRNKIKRSKLKRSKIKRSKRNKTKRIKKKQMGGSRSIEKRQEDAYNKLMSNRYGLGGDLSVKPRDLASRYTKYGKTGLSRKEGQKRIHDRIKRLEPILTGLGIKELAEVSYLPISKLSGAGISLEDISWLNKMVKSATGPEKKVPSSGMIRASGMIRDREEALKRERERGEMAARVADKAKAAMAAYMAKTAASAKTKIFFPEYFKGAWNPPIVSFLGLFRAKEPIEDSQIQKGQQFRVILLPDLRDDTAKIVQFIKKGSKSEPERYDRKCKGEIKSVGWLGTQVILNNDSDKMEEVSLDELRKVAYMELLADEPVKYKISEYRSSSELNLRLVREIGSGSYGQVINCIQVDENNKVLDAFLNPPRAVKLSKDKKDKEGGQRLIFEYEIMKELKGSLKEYTKFFPEAYIVLHSTISEQKGIVMEYLRPHTFTDGFEPSNLRKLLESGFKLLSHNHKQCYCRDLAYGIAAMHSVKIWHGDLKPENIVIAHDRSETGQLKIIDFDSCSHTFLLGESPGFDINCCHTHPINGTSLYPPPENNGESAQRVRADNSENPLIELGPSYDWWTYGLIVFEITTGRMAYTIGKYGQSHGKGELKGKDHNELYTFFQGKSQMYMDLAKNESIRNQFVQNLGISLDPENMALLELAFMFFQPRDTRPFLCLDKRQMISYKGEESKDYQSIVDKALFSNQ